MVFQLPHLHKLNSSTVSDSLIKPDPELINKNHFHIISFSISNVLQNQKILMQSGEHIISVNKNQV